MCNEGSCKGWKCFLFRNCYLTDRGISIAWTSNETAQARQFLQSELTCRAQEAISSPQNSFDNMDLISQRRNIRIHI